MDDKWIEHSENLMKYGGREENGHYTASIRQVWSNRGRALLWKVSGFCLIRKAEIVLSLIIVMNMVNGRRLRAGDGYYLLAQQIARKDEPGELRRWPESSDVAFSVWMNGRYYADFTKGWDKSRFINAFLLGTKMGGLRYLINMLLIFSSACDYRK